MNSNNNSFNDLKNLINKIKHIENDIQSLDGQTIDLNQQNNTVTNAHLHQDSESMSAEESVLFEKNNKKFFDYLQSLAYGIYRKLS